jgi:hypothetical protein
MRFPRVPRELAWLEEKERLPSQSKGGVGFRPASKNEHTGSQVPSHGSISSAGPSQKLSELLNSE